MVEYIVVRCFQCSTFQVKQVTKSNKWSCSLCAAKQSVIKVYGVSGKASDLRKLAQDLNLGRQEADAAKEAVLLSKAGSAAQEDDDDFDEALIAELEEREAQHRQSQPPRTGHKWEAYIQNAEGDGEEVSVKDDPLDTQLVTTLPDQGSKRRKKEHPERRIDDVAYQKPGQGQARKSQPALVDQDYGYSYCDKSGKRAAEGSVPTARRALQPIQAQGYKRGTKPLETEEPNWGSVRAKAAELTSGAESKTDLRVSKRAPGQSKWATYIDRESSWNGDRQKSELALREEDECGDPSIQTTWGNDEIVE
ncbi:hypothetical protein KFL_003070080 [Klebsormidium nitens]|uniref:MRN complex-interacting protein N-terminal domain-containing protein n=1 Tax=Klebsormidium nitens TaxID=105231 RepID=A0A1Y1I702_KLENI|nr:hypothetical protein KFL_003070080 [Klebsormidium nitens]|eukprot:GAQ86720.1 hypothetical protein KFL_003070080 [Klebsormidium nitens]